MKLQEWIKAKGLKVVVIFEGRDAAGKGGKTRIGFENSLYNRDGSLADSNAQRVRELVSALREAGTLNEPVS